MNVNMEIMQKAYQSSYYFCFTFLKVLELKINQQIKKSICIKKNLHYLCEKEEAMSHPIPGDTKTKS